MNAVIKCASDSWDSCIRAAGVGDMQSRPPIAEEVYFALSEQFSNQQIIEAIAEELLALVDMYDMGDLKYWTNEDRAVSERHRATICLAVLSVMDERYVDTYLLQEVIRAFPTLEWYHGIRAIIVRHCSRLDVLQAIACGVNSRKRVQVCSSALAVVYYVGQSTPRDGNRASINHVLKRIQSRLEWALSKSSRSVVASQIIDASMRHLEEWKKEA